jgi:hypothetical protein
MSEVARISTDEAMFSAVPVLLGFHPTDSVVVVSLMNEKGRCGLTCRFDLSHFFADPRAAMEQIADVMIRNYAVGCIVIFYGQEIDPRAEEFLDAAGVPVNRVLATGNDPHQVMPELAEQMAEKGRAVLSSREQLEGSVAYQRGVQMPEIDVLHASLAGSLNRDYLLCRALPHAKELLPVFIRACQATPDTHPQAVDLLAVTALLSHRDGDGALALVALNRAQAIAPHHRLAGLASYALSVGLSPDDLDGLLLNLEEMDQFDGFPDPLPLWQAAGELVR